MGGRGSCCLCSMIQVRRNKLNKCKFSILSNTIVICLSRYLNSFNLDNHLQSLLDTSMHPSLNHQLLWNLYDWPELEGALDWLPYPVSVEACFLIKNTSCVLYARLWSRIVLCRCVVVASVIKARTIERQRSLAGCTVHKKLLNIVPVFSTFGVGTLINRRILRREPQLECVIEIVCNWTGCLKCFFIVPIMMMEEETQYEFDTEGNEWVVISVRWK